MGYGKDFYTKVKSMKESRPFNESQHSENSKVFVLIDPLPKNQLLPNSECSEECFLTLLGASKYQKAFFGHSEPGAKMDSKRVHSLGDFLGPWLGPCKWRPGSQPKRTILVNIQKLALSAFKLGDFDLK